MNVSPPFSLIKDDNTILSGQLLTIHEGVEYWSYVFDVDGVIYKQASFNLAQRESYFLKHFDSPYFPKVTQDRVEGKYSVVVLEKIIGESLEAFSSKLSDPNVLFDFIFDCLNILEELYQQGITHRDIRSSNLIIRNGHPVLLDFGWAISAENQIFTPRELGDEERSPDGIHSDIYSMGKVVDKINPKISPVVKQFTSLMTSSNEYFRVTDISLLKLIWSNLEDSIKLRKPSSELSLIILKLLEQISRREEEPAQLQKQLAEIELKLSLALLDSQQKEQELQIIYKSRGWRIIMLLRRLKQWIQGKSLH